MLDDDHATGDADPLEPEFPSIHPAERHRFLVARDGNIAQASEMLRNHIAWRAAHFPRPEGTRVGNGLPEFAWVHPGRARDGTRIVSQMCCIIDPKLGSNEDYILALSGFLLDQFDRTSDEKLTVLIDSRPLEGTPNVLAIKMLPLIQAMAKTLSDHFPERLARLVVYPVPAALGFIWGLVCPFLAPKTADKIKMLGGAAGRTSPCPVKLGEIVSLDALREEDRPRHAALELYQE